MSLDRCHHHSPHTGAPLRAPPSHRFHPWLQHPLTSSLDLGFFSGTLQCVLPVAVQPAWLSFRGLGGCGSESGRQRGRLPQAPLELLVVPAIRGREVGPAGLRLLRDYLPCARLSLLSPRCLPPGQGPPDGLILNWLQLQRFTGAGGRAPAWVRGHGSPGTRCTQPSSRLVCVGGCESISCVPF